jgi:hypothetical protein
MDREGTIIAQRWFEHNGSSLPELMDWLRQLALASPSSLAAAIEIPRGAIVETMLEHGFAVFSINPRQLDRFRDRYSPAGAKDDRHDAFVLADALRTDIHCFHAVLIDEPAMIRLRELARLEDEPGEEFQRAANRPREQLQHFFPQLLQLSEAANQPWLWALFESAPSPQRAARLSQAKVERILRRHRIRRIDARQVRAISKTKPPTLAPGSRRSRRRTCLAAVATAALLAARRSGPALPGHLRCTGRSRRLPISRAS